MIKVTVFRRSGRKNFEAQWVDPITGRKVTRSTGESIRRDALRVAARIENELADGGSLNPERITWDAFRERYKSESLAGKAEKTQYKAASTMNWIEELIDPKFLRSVDAGTISKFASKLREQDLAEMTIKGHLAEVRKMVRWAAKVGLLRKAPAVTVPKITGDMKGRPITAEEFDRMKAKIAAVVGEAVAGSWAFFLEGLWWSGLRLAESLELHWTDQRRLCVDLSGRRPMLHVVASAEKGRKNRRLPIAPEFAEFLLAVPEAKRRGFVFNPRLESSPLYVQMRSDTVSKTISEIGKLAGVKVAETKKGVKYASAHDFRRAFGFRWAPRVMPAVLQELMRHASIQTTMQFYVGRLAETAADAAWQAWANTSANTAQRSPPVDQEPAA